MKFIAVYITCKNKKEARMISRHLLSKKLIACANIFQCESLFSWNGKVADEKESIIIAKSVAKHKNSITKAVKELHSYSIPCVNFFHADIGNKEYAKWLENETK